MFSVVFPGQGSQSVGMGSELHKNYGYIQDLFSNADDILGFNLSKLILEGPKENLDLTEFTQPAIFLVSFSILLISVPNTATIPPFPFGTDICIAFPLFCRSLIACSNLIAPEEAKAEYSPKE